MAAEESRRLEIVSIISAIGLTSASVIILKSRSTADLVLATIA